MKDQITSAFVVTFVLMFVLGMGAGCSNNGSGNAIADDQNTILDELVSTNGTEALAAAIQVVDSDGECEENFAELLADRLANLTLLAPPNEGFEVFLNIKPGKFQTWDANTIASLLPGLLRANDLDISDLCKLLRRHISMGEIGDDPIPLNELLEQGVIIMLDGSEYPIGISGGRGGGVCVNYESCITERDVQTQNGVIHYLHKVLEKPPVEEQDPPPLPEDSQPPPPNEIDAWCSRSACADDDDLKAECVEFMNVCLEEADKDGDIEGCWATGLFKCNERESLFGGDGIFD